MARIICEIQPRFVFVENSPMLTSRGLGRVLGDLASMGFDARWGVLGASEVGANHRRERIWIVANAMRQRWSGSKVYTSTKKSGPWSNEQFARLLQDSEKLAIPTSSGRGIHDGVASKVDRLKAIGNGQVPLCASTAWRILNEGFTN
jgi:DNA (cytosine-5)-methyltransferase 1